MGVGKCCGVGRGIRPGAVVGGRRYSPWSFSPGADTVSGILHKTPLKPVYDRLKLK